MRYKESSPRLEQSRPLIYPYWTDLSPGLRLVLQSTLLLVTWIVAGCGLTQVVETQSLPTRTPALPPVTITSPVVDLPSPTASPVDTPTPRVSETPLPSATLPPPTQTLAPVTLKPTASTTPTPALPGAEIQIFSPGPLSKIVSPLRVRALMEPGARGRILVELLGEDGRLLVRQLQSFSSPPGRKMNLSLDLEFEIAAVAEAGRLQLSAEDRFGRLVRLASVDLILLSIGDADINPPGDLLAPIVIQQPRPGMLVQGGELMVAGMARPVSSLPLAVELIDVNGRVVGTRQVEVRGIPEQGHRPFQVEVPYTVSEPTAILLVVRERSDRIQGTTQLTSLIITLSP